MGSGSYSVESRFTRAESLGYSTKSANEIFSERNINNAMNPFGVGIRESRDSAEHPQSFPIIIALDVTGSMGSIPHYLVKEGLPDIMGTIIKNGVPDPQVLFLGIGDHECDIAPLQVGQFESSDELLDHWLTKVYIEGGGGGNEGESYLLAWYFAGFHTEIDSFVKRHKKGILITIGDEPTLKSIPARNLKNLMGEGQYQEISSHELLEKASVQYDCFHIHIGSTRAGQIQSTISGWKQLMGDNLIIASQKEDVTRIISETVIKYYGSGKQNNQIHSAEKPMETQSIL